MNVLNKPSNFYPSHNSLIEDDFAGFPECLTRLSKRWMFLKKKSLFFLVFSFLFFCLHCFALGVNTLPESFDLIWKLNHAIYILYGSKFICCNRHLMRYLDRKVVKNNL